MILSVDQKDAVTELVNIAFARTAAALSELTGNRVELTVPEVSAHPLGELLPALGRFVRGEVATVHQIFGGPVSGDAFLLFDVDGAARLVDLSAGDSPAASAVAVASFQQLYKEVEGLMALQVQAIEQEERAFLERSDTVVRGARSVVFIALAGSTLMLIASRPASIIPRATCSVMSDPLLIMPTSAMPRALA